MCRSHSEFPPLDLCPCPHSNFASQGSKLKFCPTKTHPRPRLGSNASPELWCWTESAAAARIRHDHAMRNCRGAAVEGSPAFQGWDPLYGIVIRRIATLENKAGTTGSREIWRAIRC